MLVVVTHTDESRGSKAFICVCLFCTVLLEFVNVHFQCITFYVLICSDCVVAYFMFLLCFMCYFGVIINE